MQIIEHVTNKPLAVANLISYRYKGRYDWIMIGARGVEDALNEAKRSFSKTSEIASIDNLQVWNGSEYINCTVLNIESRLR